LVRTPGLVQFKRGRRVVARSIKSPRHGASYLLRHVLGLVTLDRVLRLDPCMIEKRAYLS
jgi:hypothetical protein